MTQTKLNIKQLFTIFVVAISSPIIRIYGIYLSEDANEAAWIGPIIGIIPIIILIYIIRGFFKKNPNKKMEDIIYSILGKFWGNVILVIILIWAILIFTLNTRISRSKICFFHIYIITN